jgi:methionyl-tRNA formyltransferase
VLLNGANATVGVIGCRHTTYDVLVGLSRSEMRPDICVSLPPDKGRSVPGRVDLTEVCRAHRIPLITVQSYSLTESKDRATVLSCGIELLLVVGWGRLLPPWFLDALPLHAYSVHGAAHPLPYGRGRSPVNWTLIQGQSQFVSQLFRLAPRVDDGPVVDALTFPIHCTDDAVTVHIKNTVARLEMYKRSLPAMLAGTVVALEQPPHMQATYFPKPDLRDQVVRWADRTETVHNLVRGLTAPYAGAVTFLDDDEKNAVRLWSATPFGNAFAFSGAPPGAIARVFHDGSFLVKTGDGALLVRESDTTLSPDDEGRRFGHLGTPRRSGPVPAPAPDANVTTAPAAGAADTTATAADA